MNEILASGDWWLWLLPGLVAAALVAEIAGLIWSRAARAGQLRKIIQAGPKSGTLAERAVQQFEDDRAFRRIVRENFEEGR